jgi:hypothetical protein
LNGKERETIAPVSREVWDKIKKKQQLIDKSIADARFKTSRRGGYNAGRSGTKKT